MKNEEGYAKIWYDWALTPEVQSRMKDAKSFQLPSNKKAEVPKEAPKFEDIKLIERVSGLDSLSDELREVAELRLDNIDMSLQEIGENLTEPISRSGVNHRFKKLAKIADSLRTGGKPDES